MNPYANNDFWQFFATLAKRLFTFFSGPALASDEIQVFVLGAVAISCALLGPFLVLKRMAMLANSLSHTILFGLAVSFLLSRAICGPDGSIPLSSLLIGASASALLTAFFTGALTRFFRLQEDASVGLVFTSLFSLGILLVTLFTRDVHLGVEAVMGNADALRASDLFSAALLAFGNLFLIALFFWPLQYSAFDRSAAKSLGMPCGFFQALLLFLTAATCIGAFRAVGVLLVLSFLVGPYLIARLFTHKLGKLLFLSCAIGCAASLFGVALARHLLTVHGLALSTGGIVSVLVAVAYPLSVGIKNAVSRINIFTPRMRSVNLGSSFFK